MAYLTMEGVIDGGRIIPSEPGKLPENGRILLTVLETGARKPDIEIIKSVLGTLKTDVDAVQWQRQVRAEWSNE
jgi:hypothetical protein